MIVLLKQYLLSYSDYISTEAGFCNDRRIATEDETWWSSDTKLGYGTNATAYASFSRFITASDRWASVQNPTLKCSQINDIFITSGNSNGNGTLNYPVGLITADEVVLAGGFGGENNSSYYLYTNNAYWTISPCTFYTSGYAGMFNVNLDGNLSSYRVPYVNGVRPVINLDANVTISSGDGTIDSPYQI